MYEELIKALRDRADTLYNASRLYDSDAEDAAILYKAADAIDDLSRVAEAIPHRCECCVGCELEKKNGGCDHAFVHSPKRAIQYLSKPRWIPVTERLPEKDGTFITAYSKGGVSQNWYMVFHHGGGKWYQNSEDTGEVTHWMPLPEPPKEET